MTDTQSCQGWQILIVVATRAICAQSSKLWKQDPSLNNVTATNYERCPYDADYWIADTDTVLKPFDAVVCQYLNRVPQ